MLTLLIALICIIITLIVLYFRRKFTYWKSQNVLTYPNPGIPWGHFGNPLSSKNINFGIRLFDIYNYFKTHNAHHGGIYMAWIPIYIPVNLDIIKRIFIQDFHNFDEKGLYVNEESQPIGAHMFMLGGEKWRRMRQKLSPTFTSGKLKGMFHIVDKCCHTFMDYIASTDVIEIKEVAAKYTINVIGNCAFGLETNCFENEASDFYKFGRRIFAVDLKRALTLLCTTFFPKFSYKMNIVHHYRDVEKFFTEIITETVKLREGNEVMDRGDFINLLLELKREGKGIELQDIITQSFLFFAAGFETSAGTISHLLYETAQHPRIQLRIKEEIEMVLGRYDGELTYEALQEMTYMTQVIEETLRKYPALAIFHRQASADYKVPNTDLVLKKGTKIFIPALAIHWDQDNFPRPHIFDPERFSHENKKTNPVCSWLGFGEGPRQCIGLRFALMQTKIALTNLFKTYNFKLHERSNKPIVFAHGLVLQSKEGIFIEKTPWASTNIDRFCEEERGIFPDKDMSFDEIYRLWLYGELP